MLGTLKQVIHKNKFLLFGIFTYICLSLFLISTRKNMWYDELFTLEVVKADFIRFWKLIIGDGKPPLYYLLVKFYYLAINSDSTNLLRISSTVLGIPFIIYIWKFIFVFIQNKYKYLIAILLFLNPLFLIYSTEFRMYTMLASSTLIYLYYFYKYYIAKDEKYLTKLRLARSLALLTSYIGIFYFFSEILYKIIDNKLLNIKKRLLGIPIIFKQYRVEILSFLAVCTFIASQIFLFPNFNPFWVEKFSISSITNTVGVLLLGTDPGIPGKSSPFFVWQLMTNSSISISISTIIYLIITIFILLAIFKLIKLNILNPNKDVSRLSVFVFLILLMIILVSQPFMPISFYQERYLIGISLSSMFFVLIMMEKTKIKLLIIASTLITILYSVTYLSLISKKIEFAKPADSDAGYIKYYYTDELNRCGLSIFEKRINNCL